MNYLFTELEKIQPEELYPVLGEQRREKALRYRFECDRKLSSAAFVLLRLALYEEYGIKSLPELSEGEHGKPSLTNSDICFNFSHCKNAVLCGIGKKPLGADVQEYRESVVTAGRRVFTDRERESIRDVRGLTRLWTLKEAYGKYTGEGLVYDCKNTDFSDISDSTKVQLWNGLDVLSEELDDFALSIVGGDDMRLIGVTARELKNFTEMTKKHGF